MSLVLIRKKLIQVINEEVKKRKLSIRRMAEMSDLSYSQIQKILADDNPNVSLDSLLTLCDALKLSYELDLKNNRN
ncbi:Cro/C1-type helix-turn-helix DNA-binding protein [Leptospira meyeri]|uniref:Cro/C1-type helix-turn-helix DNA-binding protein n=1 Tax=Leptospira meyeri TaxID=29508 RepID=A0A4R8MTF0_LEPME|nr:helix-turn-helix transcriptional regulator [Leptospira meyeri]TDY71338.1 Cro/C1-type helix-turn-helix DNA-binding protein [Leptospira meyeri]